MCSRQFHYFSSLTNSCIRLYLVSLVCQNVNKTELDNNPSAFSESYQLIFNKSFDKILFDQIFEMMMNYIANITKQKLTGAQSYIFVAYITPQKLRKHVLCILPRSKFLFCVNYLLQKHARTIILQNIPHVCEVNLFIFYFRSEK